LSRGGAHDPPMKTAIRPMLLDDYDAVYQLWSITEGVALTEDDSRDGFARYLKRNPGYCFVAVDDEKIVGTALGGHDGRRGFLRHLAVEKAYRKQGIARRLVQTCPEAIAADSIWKCNIFVMDYNADGLRFWAHLGATQLDYEWRNFQLSTTADAATPAARLK
ncbi:MAG: GNAT family N-acetyltransferase, partial [Opitutaceae bacterium]